MLLEDAVRPFQQLPVLRTLHIPVITAAVDVAPGTKTWGKAGTISDAAQVPEGTTPLGFTLETCNEHFDETSREVEPITISQDDNPANHVTFNRVSKINFKRTNANKVLSSRLQTHWSETDIWAGSNFGPLTQQEGSCSQGFVLHPA